MIESKNGSEVHEFADVSAAIEVDPVLLAAALPTIAVVQILASQLKSHAGSSIYLGFYGINSLRFVGCLVTSESIHDPIAFCPVSGDLLVGSTMWRIDVMRQLAFARELASDVNAAVPGLRLEWLRSGMIEAPGWLYGLMCVPVKRDWDGSLTQAIPFCPTRFGVIARQPQARRWLERNTVSEPSSVNCAHKLTSREKQVLNLLCSGDGEKQIAAKLQISKNTVHVYTKQLYLKFGVPSRANLLSLFINRHALETISERGQL